MAQTKMTLEEIRQSDPFMQDSQIDLSAYPWLTPLADAPGEDEQFAPLDTRGIAGSSPLRRFLNNLDREAVEELRDPEALRKFDEERGSGTTVYASNIPFQIYQRNGQWRAKGTTPDGKVHRFTSDTRDALFPKISHAVNENTVRVRDLTDAELLQIIRYIQSGDTQTALGQYLWLGTDKKEIETPFEILDDPRYRELCDQGVFFVWEHARTDYSPSPEREKYMDEYVAGRPLSLPLLDSAWKACQQAEKDHGRSALLGQLDGEAETVPDAHAIGNALEESSDADIERLMRGTTRQYAKEVRAGLR